MEQSSKTPKKGKKSRKRSTASGRASSPLRGRSSGGINDWLSRAGQRVADAGSHISMPQLGTLESAIESRPAVLGAVGIAIGMVIGAMLPSMAGMMHTSSATARSRPGTRH